MPSQVGSPWPVKCSFEYVHCPPARITTQAGSATIRQRNDAASQNPRLGAPHSGCGEHERSRDGADQRHRSSHVQEQR